MVNQAEVLVLQRILKGLVEIREADGVQEVWSFHCGRNKWAKKSWRVNQGRACYQICGSTGYRNRLLWMIANRRAIPNGYHVDHVDLDKTNDHTDNLRLMSESDSHRQGNEIQKDLQLERLSRRFEWAGAGFEFEHVQWY